jgi:hypothetical protein
MAKTKRIVAAAKFIGGPYDGGVMSWPMDWMKKSVRFPRNTEIEQLGLDFDPMKLEDQYVHLYRRETKCEQVSGFVIFVYSYQGVVEQVSRAG